MATCKENCIHYSVCGIWDRKVFVDYEQDILSDFSDLPNVEEHCRNYLPKQNEAGDKIMKIIRIDEENHGFIGVASSMKAAWQFIVNKGWLGFWDNVYIFDHWVGIDEIFDQNGWNKTNENLVEWAMNRGEDTWDGLFYFSECEVYEEN